VSHSPSSEARQVLKRSGTVAGFTLLSRLLGAVRDLTLSHLFGASGMLDAFIQAFTIPNMFRRLTAEGSMNLALVPVYTEARERSGVERARHFAAQGLGLVLTATVLLTALGMCFTPQLVWLFAAGFEARPEQFALTVELTRWMFPYLVLVSCVAWAMAVLNAEGRFASAAAAPILLNLGILGGALLLAPGLEEPMLGVAGGVLLGGAAQVLLQWPSLRGCGLLLRPRSFWTREGSAPEIRQLLGLLGPSLFGVAAYQLNLIVLRNLASFLPEGQVTHYYNASRLTELTLGVFAFAITTASFPEFSRHVAQQQWKRALGTLRFSTHSTLMIVLPAAAGLVVAAEPITAMLYLHGAYRWDDVQQTAAALQAFALSLPMVALIRLQTSAFYALKDSKTPVRVAFLSIVVTGGLGYWWSQSLQVTGLALGLSAGTTFQWLVLQAVLRRRLPGTADLWTPLRHLGASVVMGGCVWMLAQRDWSSGPTSLANWGMFLLLLFTGGGLYAASLLVLQDPYALRLIRRLRRADST
jgi:putative peptidoglycan lipid II flippase